MGGDEKVSVLALGWLLKAGATFWGPDLANSGPSSHLRFTFSCG